MLHNFKSWQKERKKDRATEKKKERQIDRVSFSASILKNRKPLLLLSIWLANEHSQNPGLVFLSKPVPLKLFQINKKFRYLLSQDRLGQESKNMGPPAFFKIQI